MELLISLYGEVLATVLLAITAMPFLKKTYVVDKSVDKHCIVAGYEHIRSNQRDF